MFERQHSCFCLVVVGICATAYMPPVLHLAQIQARVTFLQQDDIQVPASMLPVRQQLEGKIFFKAPAYMLPIHHQGRIQAPASMLPLL